MRHTATADSLLKRNQGDKSLHQRSREEASNSYQTNDNGIGFSSRNKGQKTEPNSRFSDQEILLHDRLAHDTTVRKSSKESLAASEEYGSKSSGSFLYTSKKILIEKTDNSVKPLSSNQISRLSSSPNSNTSRPGPSTDERQLSSLQEQESGVPRRASSLQSSIDQQVFNPSTSVTSKNKNINGLNQTNFEVNSHVKNALPHNIPLAQSKIRNRVEKLGDVPNPPVPPPKVIKSDAKGFTPVERSSALYPRISHEKAASREASADESSPVLHHRKNVFPKAPANGSKDHSLNGFNPSMECDKIEKKMGKEEEEGDPSVVKNRRDESACLNVSTDSGFRPSFEVSTVKDSNARWSDSDNSDEDEDDCVSGASNISQEKEAPSPPETVIISLFFSRWFWVYFIYIIEFKSLYQVCRKD